MKSALVLAGGVALLAFAGVANSGHGCNGAVTDIGGMVYIDDRDINTGGIWVYVESNGTAGMQSGGASILLGQNDIDPCQHANPDTLII